MDVCKLMDIHKLYTKAYDWVLIYGPKIVMAIVLFIVGIWIIKLLRKIIFRALSKRVNQSGLVRFVVSLCITGLQILLIMLVLQVAGVQMTLFAALIAALGVAAGLALSGTLQNFTSGVM